jgi:PASTA domain-containing protein
MTVQTADLFDATNANIGSLPKTGFRAGYVTGSGDVPWSAANQAANPGFVRIAQSPVESFDELGHPDVLDYESGAATDSNVVPWAKAEIASFHSGTRPGQRMPAVYVSRRNVTHLVNILIAGGITSGVGLGIADWNNDPNQATQEVANASGPFPVVWRQYANRGNYDAGIVSVPWLTNVSVAPSKTVSVPNVVGQSAGAAHNALAAAELVPTADPGQKATEVVTSLVPAVGSIVAVGSQVKIIASAPPLLSGVVVTTQLNVIHVTSSDTGKTWLGS